MVFKYFGITRSEDDLIRQLGTKKDTGTEHQPPIDAVLEEGLHCYVNNDSSFDEIKYFLGLKLPVIVNFIEPTNDDGHFAVVVEINSDDIILNDPWNGKDFSLPLAEFERRWISGHGTYRKWIAAISAAEITQGKQYHPTPDNHKQ